MTDRSMAHATFRCGPGPRAMSRQNATVRSEWRPLPDAPPPTAPPELPETPFEPVPQPPAEFPEPAPEWHENTGPELSATA
jgi:hypothetical protein